MGLPKDTKYEYKERKQFYSSNIEIQMIVTPIFYGGENEGEDIPYSLLFSAPLIFGHPPPIRPLLFSATFYE